MNINKQKITCTLVRVSFGTPLLLFLETPLTIHILPTLVTTNVRMCNSSGAGTVSPSYSPLTPNGSR